LCSATLIEAQRLERAPADAQPARERLVPLDERDTRCRVSSVRGQPKDFSQLTRPPTIQRPTSSHFCKNAPSVSRIGDEHVAQGGMIRAEVMAAADNSFFISFPFSNVPVSPLKVACLRLARQPSDATFWRDGRSVFRPAYGVKVRKELRLRLHDYRRAQGDPSGCLPGVRSSFHLWF